MTAAVAEEQRDGQRRVLLLPVRIDEAIEGATTVWARRMKQTRQIADFRGWEELERYREALERLLSDLQATGEETKGDG